MFTPNYIALFCLMPFILVALVIGIIGLSEIIAKKRFLKNAEEAIGTVVLKTPAVNRVDYQQGYTEVPDIDIGGELMNGSPKSYLRDAGMFLWVDFTDYKGIEYGVRTKKPYLNHEEIKELSVKYNPIKPAEEYMIDGFYSYSKPHLKVIAAAILLVTIFVIVFVV